MLPVTMTLTVSVDESLPSSSVTTSENVRVASTFGASKLGLAESALLSVTPGPPVWVQENEAPLPSLSELPLPSKTTAAPGSTV